MEVSKKFPNDRGGGDNRVTNGQSLETSNSIRRNQRNTAKS